MATAVLSFTFFQSRFFLLDHDNMFSEDLQHFRKLTTGNIVVMGHETWKSLPDAARPLKNRVNIVLSRTVKKKDIQGTMFTNVDGLLKLKLPQDKKVFVIGGAEIYGTLMYAGFITNMILTYVPGLGEQSHTFDIPSNFRLHGVSEALQSVKHEKPYRILYYNKVSDIHEEYKYLNHFRSLLVGHRKTDRTGTGTLSKFGNQLTFDISNGTLPLITTKRLPFKSIVEELLWICRGDTDAKILQQKGIKIWDGNSSREFLDNRGLQHYPPGVIGPAYGFLWRHFGSKYSPKYSDTSKYDMNLLGGVDQLQKVEDLLRNDPFSRRIIISAWNPSQEHLAALPPCHLLVQFSVTEQNGEKHLSCMFTMRSSDSLAVSWNISFYTILTFILAEKCNMKAKNIIYSSGDAHVYLNHVDAIKEQISRNPRPFPKVLLGDSIKNKDWSEMTVDDFKLVGYFPHPNITMKMAI